MTTTPPAARAALSLSGELDVATVLPLRREFHAARATGQLHFDLDLDGVTFMDCASLAAILWCRREADLAGGDLVVRSASPTAHRFLALTHAEGLLQPAA